MATWVRPARHERHDYARHNRRSPPRRWVPLRPRAFQRGRRPEMSRRHESPNRSSREHMPHRGKKQRNYRDPDRERGRAKSMSHDSILSYDDEGCLKKKGDAGQKANGKGARAKYPTNQDMSLDERGTGGYGSFKRPVVDPKSSDNRKDLFEEKMLARSSSISRSSTVTSSKSGPYP
ncbi:hypothetical protein EJ05DRAFT_220857 [Pseudovirgaria hyperparasitica]|uniref:Uncharacterized protein n=1 Tax=Pseudovirgaria hyperparasitica TaxID=470096 RepID=A0A6A6VTI3_9PEZI|nr:uncharacterized protein EJ05DRAFT_220857 [Pseudovirgaria hyperparasitica]KAF2753523.1 hypothetical protein EJ05DRAFT_220857 [Pseudovirgaria hyperparasitica]